MPLDFEQNGARIGVERFISVFGADHNVLDPDAEISREVHPRLDAEAVLSERMSFLAEFWEFIWERKKFWLLPVFLLSLVLGGLVVAVKGSAIAPLIYAIF